MFSLTPSQISYLRLLFQPTLQSKGAWAAGSYAAGSLVSHSGAVWIATGMPTTGTPGVDTEWVNFREFTAVTELPAVTAADNADILTVVEGAWDHAAPAAALPDTNVTGALLYYTGAAWAAMEQLCWDVATVADGRLVLDFSTAAYRAWDAAMPGLIFKQASSGLQPGLYLNLEQNSTPDGFAGGTSGNRLDMGWGGNGGGNFELYSKEHTARSGQFRVVYGGGDFGHIQYTHYAGGTTWYVTSGLTKQGRFFCGLQDTGFPGTDDATELNDSRDAPAHPFQVYNEDSTAPAVSFAVEKTGVIDGVASLSAAPTGLAANTYRLWMSTSTHRLMITTADDSDPVVETTWEASAELPAVTAADNDKVLAVVSGSWAAAIPTTTIPAGMVMTFAGNSAPAGWLECDGESYTIAEYGALHTAIGTTYGVGDDAPDTFQVPDLRGEFVRGWDHSRGADTERALGSTQDEAIKDHDHEVAEVDGSSGSEGGFVTSSAPSATVFSAPMASAQAGTETRPRNVALMYCIKI